MTKFRRKLIELTGFKTKEIYKYNTCIFDRQIEGHADKQWQVEKGKRDGQQKHIQVPGQILLFSIRDICGHT